MADAEGLMEARSPGKGADVEEGPGAGRFKGGDNLDWGMKNRLCRLIRNDGRCQFLPIDHGYFQGPTRCLERPYETIKNLTGYADGLFVTKGVLRASIPAGIETPIILRVSGGTSVVGHDLADEVITASVEDMVRLNVSAVGISIFVGTEYERQTLHNLARLVSECEPAGIPVMAVTAVGKELEKRTSRYLSLSCRIAGELGASIVKTYYCAEEFEKVTDGCPVPVVIAGGPRCETEIEVFDFVYDGIQKGAIGVNLGRNVWQSRHPEAMMMALHSIIHEKADPDRASEVFEDMKKREA